MSKINTNLASEYFVASQLFRLGYDVTITLGNTKEIDLILINKKGKLISIDVKGLKNTTNFPMKVKRDKKTHFFVLVSYKNKIGDLSKRPVCFIVPSREAKKLLRTWSGRLDMTGIPYSLVKDNKKYKDNWNLLEKV